MHHTITAPDTMTPQHTLYSLLFNGILSPASTKDIRQLLLDELQIQLGSYQAGPQRGRRGRSGADRGRSGAAQAQQTFGKLIKCD
jgi:hypothetical protein